MAITVSDTTYEIAKASDAPAGTEVLRDPETGKYYATSDPKVVAANSSSVVDRKTGKYVTKWVNISTGEAADKPGGGSVSDVGQWIPAFTDVSTKEAALKFAGDYQANQAIANSSKDVNEMTKGEFILLDIEDPRAGSPRLYKVGETQNGYAMYVKDDKQVGTTARVTASIIPVALAAIATYFTAGSASPLIPIAAGAVAGALGGSAGSAIRHESSKDMLNAAGRGAVVGAVGGAAGAYAQGASNAASGATASATGSQMAGNVAGGAVTGAASGAAGSAAGQLYDRDGFDWGQVASDTAVGAVAGAGSAAVQTAYLDSRAPTVDTEFSAKDVSNTPLQGKLAASSAASTPGPTYANAYAQQTATQAAAPAAAPVTAAPAGPVATSTTPSVAAQSGGIQSSTATPAASGTQAPETPATGTGGLSKDTKNMLWTLGINGVPPIIAAGIGYMGSEKAAKVQEEANAATLKLAEEQQASNDAAMEEYFATMEEEASSGGTIDVPSVM